jgi:hypothetical protein
MRKLNQVQRLQVRKDLTELQDANLKIQSSGLVPGHAKEAAKLSLRIIETLADAAGAFDESEETNHG